MKSLSAFLIQITILLISLNGFTQTISNLHFQQIEDNIHIYYDLETDESCTILLFYKPKSTHNWGMPLAHISGAMGCGQSSGKYKKIIWDVLQDQRNIVGNIQFKIEAIPESGMRLYANMISHPAYFISCFMVADEETAREKVYSLKIRGLRAHYYWIPDVIKKGESFYEVVIGPYKSKSQCQQPLLKIKNEFRENAYILRIE